MNKEFNVRYKQETGVCFDRKEDKNTSKFVCTIGKDPQCYLRIPALTRIWLRRSHGGTWPVIMASRIATPSGPSRGIGTPFISRTSSSLTQDFFSQSTTLTPGPSIDSTVDWISWSSIPKNVIFLVLTIFFFFSSLLTPRANLRIIFKLYSMFITLYSNFLR